MIDMNKNKDTTQKGITFLDIFKGIAFSLAMLVAYYAIVFSIVYIAGYNSEIKTPLVRVIAIVTAIIIYCLTIAFGKAREAGFKVTDIFKFLSKNQK
jgi:hypothetical protein